MRRSPFDDFDGPDTGGRPMPRRDFLRGLAAAGATGVVATILGPRRPARAATELPPDFVAAFPDGVKSGDPNPQAASIWTRIERPPGGERVPVMWTVAEDEAMQNVISGGVAWADDLHGHTVTVRARHLAPNHWYHYRFEAPGAATRVGRLRTAPFLDDAPDRLRYAFASCQQRTASHYVAHRAIAAENVDFLMHLGDYIYVSDGGDITVDNYRRRWRIFNSHPDLQEMHRTVPVVTMWDDGEFYNGVDRTGPPARLAAARQAFFEHQPVPRNRFDRLYRRLTWGTLADVLMVDVRSYRDPEVPANTSIGGLISGQDSRIPPGEQMFAPGRTTLGTQQLNWLEKQLRRRRPRWHLVGCSYNVNPWKAIDLDTPALRAQNPNLRKNEGVYISNEAWDDYQAERRRLLQYVQKHGIKNVAFTCGHTHIYLASELQAEFDDPRTPTVAFDFTTGSLTADPDPRTIAPEDVLKGLEPYLRQQNDPYMKYVNLLDQGYAVVDLTPEELIVEFRVLDTFDAAAEPRTAARFRVVNGGSTMEVLFTER